MASKGVCEAKNDSKRWGVPLGTEKTVGRKMPTLMKKEVTKVP